MADQRSVEKLAFNFASKTFAYRRHAQSLNRSVSAFPKFMREYLDPVVKLLNVLNTWTTMASQPIKLRTLSGSFGWLSSAIAQWIDTNNQEVPFRSRTSWIPKKNNFTSRSLNVHNFLDQVRFPRSKKWLQRYLEFTNYYRNYIPTMAEKLNPFHKLLKTEVPTKRTSELNVTFYSVNKPISNACELALKQPIPGKQLVSRTDVSFRTAG